MLKGFFGPRSKRTSLKRQVLPVCNEVYTSLFELPLHNWIEATLTKDFSRWLVKSGQFTDEELKDAWTNLSDEYREISGDTDSNYLFDLQKQIFIEDKHYMLIVSIINQLRVHRSEALINILKNDFNFQFDYVDLSSDLDRTLKQIKGRLLKLRLHENEFTELSERQGHGEVSRMDFIEQLAVLSAFQNYQIRVKDISVAEYIAIFRRFKADIEARTKVNV